MTINYTWKAVQMDAYPQADGKQDVVFTVHWTVSGTDGAYTGSAYGSCGVSVDADAPFTPYADLTQDQVLGWIWESGVDKDATQDNIATQISNQVNPTVVIAPLPWAEPIAAVTQPA